jgi:hypothetical protein
MDEERAGEFHLTLSALSFFTLFDFENTPWLLDCLFSSRLLEHFAPVPSDEIHGGQVLSTNG